MKMKYLVDRNVISKKDVIKMATILYAPLHSFDYQEKIKIALVILKNFGFRIKLLK